MLRTDNHHDFIASSRRRRARTLPGLLIGAALTLGVSVAVASAATSTPTAAKCSRAHLRMNFVRRQGATSHVFIDYAFLNAGGSACTLRGYPAVVLVNKSGNGMHRKRAIVSDNPVSPVRTVVIKPGKRAFFTFSWAVGGACPGHSFTFYALRVTPPGDHRNFQRQLSKSPACNRSARVSAVRPKLATF